MSIDKEKMSRRAFLALLGACAIGWGVSMENASPGFWDRQIFGVDLHFVRDDSLPPLKANGNAWRRQDGWIQIQLTGGSITGRKITKAHVSYNHGVRHSRSFIELYLSIDPGNDDTITPNMKKMQWRVYGDRYQDVEKVNIQVDRNGRWEEQVEIEQVWESVDMNETEDDDINATASVFGEMEALSGSTEENQA